MIRDHEDLLKALQAHVMAGLNARITAINTEKDDFEIATIKADDSHYVYAGELLDLPNHDFVQFAIDGEIETNHSGGGMISMPTVMIEVVFDNPKDRNTYWKSMRYMRALYEVMLEFNNITVDDLKISNLVPMFVTTLKRNLVVSGVKVSCAISS